MTSPVLGWTVWPRVSWTVTARRLEAAVVWRAAGEAEVTGGGAEVLGGEAEVTGGGAGLELVAVMRILCGLAPGRGLVRKGRLELRGDCALVSLVTGLLSSFFFRLTLILFLLSLAPAGGPWLILTKGSDLCLILILGGSVTTSS